MYKIIKVNNRNIKRNFLNVFMLPQNRFKPEMEWNL